jgi:3'-phosphoadenosine 5'-phosphosulfate sulfotransferase (PAPS reductase)/FAD synthetase
VSNILMPEDPAFQRYERLVDALGTGPTHTAYENAALARIVSWSSPEDCAVLTRLVHKARRDAFEVGRLNAQAEAEGGTE